MKTSTTNETIKRFREKFNFGLYDIQYQGEPINITDEVEQFLITEITQAVKEERERIDTWLDEVTQTNPDEEHPYGPLEKVYLRKLYLVWIDKFKEGESE